MLRKSLLSAAGAIALLTTPMALGQSAGVSGITITQPGESSVSQSITLGVNKSTVVDLPRPVADVVITNAAIADAFVQSREKLIFRGIAVGQTNAFLFDDDGNEIVNFEIDVENDLDGLQRLLARHLPGINIEAESVNGSVVLTGGVESASEAEKVVELTGLFGAANIINHLDVAAADQVLLEVRVVEMQRTYLKQLGINPNVNVGFGEQANQVEKDLFSDDGTGNFIATGEQVLAPGNPFTNSVNSQFETTTSTDGFNTTLGYTNFVIDELQSEVTVDINALERIGVARTLAEPNLTTISGEEANFLAGGEIPVPTPPNDQGISGIEYRPFGVTLGFTPVVLSENRISLQIATEVSEIAATSTVNGAPSFTTRNVESTVELPSGRSMMLAGLIQSRTNQQLDQIPGLKEVPVLGSLYQSRDFSNDETELVIIITPYLVNPSRKQDLRSPADGFSNPSDSDTILFGKINRMYSEGDGALSSENYQAPVGFIEE